MSRQDMADYLGLTIETVSRTITQLAAEGLIRLRGCRSIEFLDRPALQMLCE
jgi:CRP/FNR family nitrogen fixation transcriptional regulator